MHFYNMYGKRTVNEVAQDLYDEGDQAKESEGFLAEEAETGTRRAERRDATAHIYNRRPNEYK